MEEQEHVLFIKNMVCNRCILVVSEMLKNLNFNPVRLELGKVVVEEPLKPADRVLIRKALEALGFELLDDKRHRLIEQIRTAIIELVHYENNLSKLKLSEYLSGRCHYDYSLLSKLFSEGNGISIEKYYIAQKVERIKELLIYDELTIGEIATQLQYSSVAHLSSQFRQVTGMSPSVFRSATMFTFISIGQILNRRTSVYNSLAASAVVLILFDPFVIFHIGFQLSYSAILGILLIQSKISALVKSRNKIIRYF